MDNNQILSLLEKHVPATAVGYCLKLWQEQPFLLRLRKNRVSKLGDFSCHPGKHPQITINKDSHPYSFLITYIHEVAHLVVHDKWRSKVNPHGKEWKQSFGALFQPLLTTQVFPADVLAVLQRHLRNPRASSFSDTSLSRILRKYDQRLVEAIFLSELPEGASFNIRGRLFIKGQQKRTRAICHELKTRRNYLIPIDAQVDILPASN